MFSHNGLEQVPGDGSVNSFQLEIVRVHFLYMQEYAFFLNYWFSLKYLIGNSLIILLKVII